ncbi:hypothetical protein E4U09_000870 [Claviceps aff. purpurea]|uniref:RNase MRP protein 1 RNA binding domain-containing protein n=1 Tax=Claviceps aff. purpurea TaxID=1967640 RepID=A0A9P7U704_9HYPO|nr:hypothetical protein E4U09_000870 [Claviceps aff. purpurea]
MTLHRKPHGPSLLPSSASTCSAQHNGKNAHTEAPTDELRAILSTILPLLDAFNHRHRNQHRASFWWSTFGNFRRSLARLARALQHQIPDNKRHGIDHVSARVTWLNSHFLPRAFVAFSQLVTDNQHAPLGLLLLAVLSQVHGVCAKWEPPDKRVALAEQVAKDVQRGEQSSRLDIYPAEAIDRGTAISRNTFLGGVQQYAPTADIAVPKKALRTASEQVAQPSTKEPGVEESKVEKREKNQEKKKKKKKNKEGDTLSSLFGSLA